MLILTRRVGETLMIGDEVTVTVLGVKGNQVRIGVNAPKEVAVHREEIYDRIKREQDADAKWRTAANRALAEDYAPLFERLDALVFLAAPSFDAIYRWRLEQEQKLAATAGGPAIMDAAAIAGFISHYERITRHNLATLPARADIIMTLDEGHAVVASKGRILPAGPNS